MAPAARCGTDRCPLVPMSQAGHSGCFCGLTAPLLPQFTTLLSLPPSCLQAGSHGSLSWSLEISVSDLFAAKTGIQSGEVTEVPEQDLK